MKTEAASQSSAPRGAAYEFEGQMLTIAQIHAIVPAISHSCIRNHLKNGRNTRHAMLNFSVAAVSARGGRIAARRVKMGPGREPDHIWRRLHVRPGC